MTFEEAKNATIAAILDPQVGDCYHEMLSYWMWVVRVTKRSVYWVDAKSDARTPIFLPSGGQLHRASRQDFEARMCYNGKATNGTWLILHKRGCDVQGWYDATRTTLKIWHR